MSCDDGVPFDLGVHAATIKFEAWVCCLFLILMFGIFGNLFAMTAILQSKRYKKYHFHENWISSSIFFIHLLVVDLIYCLFLVAKGIHGFRIWKKLDIDMTNERECKFFILGEQTFSNIGGWSMMLIVYTQAIRGMWYASDNNFACNVLYSQVGVVLCTLAIRVNFYDKVLLCPSLVLD